MAKVGNDYFPDFTIDYVVGAAVAEAHQKLQLFKPDPTDFPEPAGGYPVLVITSALGYATSAPLDEIPQGVSIEYRALSELGIAVGFLGVTGTYSAAGVRNTTSIGGGMFHPPGTTGWDDDLRYSGCKEAVLASQKLKFSSDTYGIDPAKIVFQGFSFGSTCMGAPAYWPDQADPSKSDHRQASSRLCGAMLNFGQYDQNLYDPDINTPTQFSFFPDAEGDQVSDLAMTFGDTHPGYLDWASAFARFAKNPTMRAINGASTPLWAHMGLSGITTTNMAVTGELGQDSGLVSSAAGTLDPRAFAAFHETASIVLMAKQVAASDVNGYHKIRDRYWVDATASAHIVANDSEGAALMSGVLPLSLTDTDVLDAQLDWLGMLFAGTFTSDPHAAQAGGRDSSVLAGSSRGSLKAARAQESILSGASGSQLQAGQ